MHEASAPDPGLECVYRAAEYCVHGDGPCGVLRIGEASPWLDALLPDGAGAAFLTGWNPLGSLQDPAANRAANARLAERARALGIASIAGTGRAPDGSWEEQSLLLVGLSATQAMELAREFRQLAYVWIPGRRRVPALAWTGLRPPGPVPAGA